MKPVCLAIGGSDSSGLAGIQADLRTFDRLHCRGCSAITALTAQQPAGFVRSEPTPLAQLDAELQAAFAAGDVAVVKTGMLVDAERIALVAAHLDLEHRRRPVIVDPVLRASSGAELLDAGGIQALGAALLPLATLITPNWDEAQLLSGTQSDDAQALLDALAAKWPQAAILLKGGHARETAEEICDVLQLADGTRRYFRHPRQQPEAMALRGTGCRLASAIAAYLAQGNALEQAVGQAIDWLQKELTAAR